MTPYEILLSESQERMLLVAERGKEEQILAICRKWDIDAAVIGEVTDTKRWVIKATPGFDPFDNAAVTTNPIVACDIPVEALTEKAPVYDRPRATDATADARNHLAAADVPVPGPEAYGDALLALLGSPNVGSRQWIWRQYDHIVRGGTVVRPGSDAAVVRVPCERDGKVIEKHLAFAVDCNGRFCELSPEQGSARAIAEVCRNLVCSGAEPIGITDCLNFGNPERPEIMDQLARSIDGLAEGCRKLSVPIVSGNVSLYNETDGRAILPTPSVAAVGLLRDPDDRLTQWWKGAGDVVLLLGAEAAQAPATLSGGEYLATNLDRVASVDGVAPSIDLDLEARLQALVLELARARALTSAHDVSDGGLAVALAECATTAPHAAEDVGATIRLDGVAAGLGAVAALFGEAASRIVVSVAKDKVAAVRDAARAKDVPVTELGVTGGDKLTLEGYGEGHGAGQSFKLEVPLGTLRTTRQDCLVSIVGR